MRVIPPDSPPPSAPALPVPTWSASDVASVSPSLPVLSTPRIDTLLASHHARHHKARASERELLHALHVDSRLEAVESHLAALRVRQSPEPSPTASPKKRPAQALHRRSVRGRRHSSEETEVDVQSVAAEVQRIAEKHEAVKAKLERATAARRESEWEERRKKGDDGPQISSRTDAAQDDAQVQSIKEAVPPSQVVPLPDPRVAQLEEQLAVLQSALEEERAHRAREKTEAARVQEEASATAVRLHGELAAEKVHSATRARESEELQQQLAAATRRSREAEEALARLEKELRQNEERTRRSEAAALYEEERRWSERLTRAERQLADAEASERRTRAELARKDDECEQLRRSLLHTQPQLSQAEVSERALRAGCEELTASVSRLQQSLREAEEESAREKRERAETSRRGEEQRAREKEEWQVERQRLVRVCEEMEQRLAALQRYYLQRQHDVSDLKELLKLSVKRERDAAVQVEQLRLETGEALKAAAEWKGRWEADSREWEVQRSTLQALAAAHESLQRAGAELTHKLGESQSEAQRLRDDNVKLRREVEEQKRSVAPPPAAAATLRLTRRRVQLMWPALLCVLLVRRMAGLVETALLDAVRDELLVQKKVVENQTDSLRSLQAQLQQLKTSSEQTARKDGDHNRQLAYLTQQRDELQRRLEDLQAQLAHGQEQLEMWREKDRQRRVRWTPRTRSLLRLPACLLILSGATHSRAFSVLA